MAILRLLQSQTNQQVWFSLSAMLLAFWMLATSAVVLAAKMLAGGM